LSCIPSALVLNAFPDWLKPTASKLTTIVSRIYVERCMRYLNPMFTQRIADAEALKKDPNSRAPLPNDLITWAVNDALDRGEAREGLERLLIARLFMVNFAAVETSTATITNTLYDLFTMAPEENFAEAVQGEALSVFKNVGDPPNKEDVLKLVRIDSAIKETLRQRTIFVALQRQVVDPNGVTTDEGLYLPGGSRLAISAIGVHNDDDYWADATRYDAFRHCQISKKTTENSKADSGKAENGQPNPLQTFSHSLAAASEHYMPFGLGRHSCPGRTFAADEMKLIIGHIFQRYDIKYVGQQRVGTTPIANLNADILIRRRPETLPTRAK
jgi:cytochrome P450